MDSVIPGVGGKYAKQNQEDVMPLGSSLLDDDDEDQQFNNQFDPFEPNPAPQ